jgi:hypothetical protein
MLYFGDKGAQWKASIYLHHVCRGLRMERRMDVLLNFKSTELTKLQKPPDLQK